MRTSKIWAIGIAACLGIYLFASAPSELPDTALANSAGEPIEVERMFNALNALNDAARGIYTKRVVGGGLKAGLKFGEDWAEPGVEKGPLPALFLRVVAGRIESKPPTLGLYLGSDEPINKSNLFTGEQAENFAKLKSLGSPLIDQVENVGFVGMYPDLASVKPCVSCHNDHADSPKTDWKLDDMMGATTWIYPKGMLSPSEYLVVTEAFYRSVEEAYTMYLEKTAQFAEPVPIGPGWPEEGKRQLPDLETFMAAVKEQASPAVLSQMILAENLSGQSQ